MDSNNEVPKHKKRSNKKKPKKSKHKHVYTECLLYETNNKRYMNGEYCSTCGKIGNISLINKRLETYKLLEVKEIEDIFKNKIINIGGK